MLPENRACVAAAWPLKGGKTVWGPVWSGPARPEGPSGNVWREIRLCLKRSSRCSYITGCLVTAAADKAPEKLLSPGPRRTHTHTHTLTHTRKQQHTHWEDKCLQKEFTPSSGHRALGRLRHFSTRGTRVWMSFLFFDSALCAARHLFANT